MVLDDRRLKIHDLADMAGISKSAVDVTLAENAIECCTQVGCCVFGDLSQQ